MKTTSAILFAAILAAGAASAQTQAPPQQNPNGTGQAQATDQMDGMANANPSSKDMTKKKHDKKQAKTHTDGSTSTSQGDSGTRGNTNADIDRRGGDADTGAVRPTDTEPSNAAPNTSKPTAPTR